MTLLASTGSQRPLRPALRALLGRLGPVGLGLVASGIALFGYALFQGVHCPHCDAHLLGDGLPGWVRYFWIKDGLVVLGGTLGLSSLAGTQGRAWGALAVVLALGLLALTPG
jgi:hypothetical protein